MEHCQSLARCDAARVLRVSLEFKISPPRQGFIILDLAFNILVGVSEKTESSAGSRGVDLTSVCRCLILFIARKWGV